MRLVWVGVALLVGSTAASAQDQQLGARTKGMGGSYTAFEDDPVSVWLNPAWIATQPDQGSIAYHTYTAYPVKQERVGGSIDTDTEAETILVDPALLPAYLGLVFQLGDPEDAMAIGVCYARPYHLKYAMDLLTSATQTVFEPRANVEQSLSRFRVAFAKDFRFRPVGETGLFTHLAVGVGADVSYERWEFTQSTDIQGIVTFTTEDDDTTVSLGFGFGILLGVYDNGESLKINFGLAYQSAVEYEFDIEPDILPAFDMPQQLNAGLTLYLLEGTPLRFTIDFQWIDWSETAEDPILPGQNTFEDAINFSIGVEYRIDVSEGVYLYPRFGIRRFDAPWDDENDLPVTGQYKLVLDTKDEAFLMFTYGIGISWTTENGKVRTIDIAGDAGGDSVNVAIGYTHEF
jgi:long-subunit fatty acid transport protein